MNLSLRQKDTIGDYGVIGIRLFNRTFQLGSENKRVPLLIKERQTLFGVRRRLLNESYYKEIPA